MNWFLPFLLFIWMAVSVSAQGFQGTLKITLIEEGGFIQKADVTVGKQHNFYISIAAGGNGKHKGYLYKKDENELYCFLVGNPEKAVKLPADKVFELYEKKGLKEGFKKNSSQTFDAGTKSKQVGAVLEKHKITIGKDFTADVWEVAYGIEYEVLLPLLRLAGFWNEVQDQNANIVEVVRTNTKTQKTSTIKVGIVKAAVNPLLFTISKNTEVVDVNKLLKDHENSTKLPQLLKGFAGF